MKKFPIDEIWTYLPDWVEWIARDATRWWAYAEKPELKGLVWASGHKSIEISGITPDFDDNWQYSLHQRPREHKPCPRCGGNAKACYEGNWYVYCVSCNISTHLHTSEADAWEDWDQDFNEKPNDTVMYRVLYDGVALRMGKKLYDETKDLYEPAPPNIAQWAREVMK